MTKISFFRRSLEAGAASVLLLVVAIGEVSSQTTTKPEPETPAELAQAVAHAIDTSIPKKSDVPLVFESATSHDNVVEVHYRANETRVFPQNDAERENQRLRFAYRFCFDGRIWPRKKHGVVIRQVLAAPDNRASFEFTIDEAICAAIAADIEARAKAADLQRPQSLDGPKRVPTITVRPDRSEQN
jgi:hypothetical protein